ncbi:MAG: hypothetical protein ACXAD7_23335 [Candidatus Kariarchaeaceae archaeon]|jgi:hypothetical protein
MKTTTLPDQPDAKSPAGADIRFLIDGKLGNMIHSTVPPHQTKRPFTQLLANSGTFWKDKERFGGIMAWNQCYQSRSRDFNRYSSRNSFSVPKRIRYRLEVHLYRLATLAGRLGGYVYQRKMETYCLITAPIDKRYPSGFRHFTMFLIDWARLLSPSFPCFPLCIFMKILWQNAKSISIGKFFPVTVSSLTLKAILTMISEIHFMLD